MPAWCLGAEATNQTVEMERENKPRVEAGKLAATGVLLVAFALIAGGSFLAVMTERLVRCRRPARLPDGGAGSNDF